MKREERVRLFNLAREWNVESKVLVELCQQLGIAAASQLTTLEPSEVTRLRDAYRNSRAQPAPPKAAAPSPESAVPPPAKPVPAALVAPVPAPVWDQNLRARPAVAAAKPVVVAPPVAPAPPPVAGALPPAPATPPPAVPAQPVPSSAPAVPQPARPAAARSPAPGRPAPRTATPAVEQNPLPPSAPVVRESSPGAPVPARNPGIAQLLAIGARVGIPELDLVPRLAEIDTACAVFKIQQITERLCRKVLGVRGPRQLDVMIAEIEQRNLLGKKAVSYLRHIQNLGNHAAQNTDDPFGEEFTLLDVNNAAATLASVLEAAISAKRIETR